MFIYESFDARTERIQIATAFAAVTLSRRRNKRRVGASTARAAREQRVIRLGIGFLKTGEAASLPHACARFPDNI